MQHTKTWLYALLIPIGIVGAFGNRAEACTERTFVTEVLELDECITITSRARTCSLSSSDAIHIVENTCDSPAMGTFISRSMDQQLMVANEFEVQPCSRAEAITGLGLVIYMPPPLTQISYGPNEQGTPPQKCPVASAE